jgi:hypothetical protein
MPGGIAVDTEDTMPNTLKPIRVVLMAVAPAGPSCAEAAAQETAIPFRVVAADRNPAACQRLDAALARVHNFTATGGASLRSAGGVNSGMP